MLHKKFSLTMLFFAVIFAGLEMFSRFGFVFNTNFYHAIVDYKGIFALLFVSSFLFYLQFKNPIQEEKNS